MSKIREFKAYLEWHSNELTLSSAGGTNKATTLVLKTDFDKLVSALKDIAEAYAPGTIAGQISNQALADVRGD